MPDANNGVGLYITDDGRYGPYLDAPASQRIYFRIQDFTKENFYFGLNPRVRDNASVLPKSTNLYYQIKNPNGDVVYGPFLFNTANDTSTGYISSYAKAVVGPNINGSTGGYNPIVFNTSQVTSKNPTPMNGDYYIEIYKSSDNGATRTTNGNDIVVPYFDFTVSDTSRNITSGRIFSRKWGFITYNPATFIPAIEYDFKGKFYGYTDDEIIVSVEFQEGFRPFGYLLSMNKFGVVENDNDSNNVWETTRKSISYGNPTSNSIPALLNGYPVFITEPDQNAFPPGNTTPPVLIGNIYGCPGNYLIPVKLNEPGDVAITLDLNGVQGFQEETEDIIIEAYNQPQGNIVIFWDGNNGLGFPASGNTESKVTLTSLRGRTSIPMVDAELNPNGLTIASIAPVLSNRKMYWDDSGIVVTNNNSTVGGFNRSNPEEGLQGPTHKWNGDNPPGDNTLNTPAPAGGKGNATTNTTDDYGNERVLNTWFYGEQVSSPVTSISLPNCDIDNDGYSDNVDLDDDNDGILDTVELGSFDPNGDHDSDTVPDYIDPQFPGFIDTNGDGVDDRFDLDLDGRINSWDLDSDGDGIPDNIEAQTTLGFVAASTTVDSNGIPTNYPGGLSVVNTDGDANPDYLDTDSDGDTLLDTAEAGLTLSGSDSDNDGLDNNVDATSGSSDVDGTINNPNTLPDDDNDLNAGGDVDYRDTTDSDFDNDNVADTIDLDDDNDGILDTVENANCTGVLNYEFYDGVPPGNTVNAIPTTGAIGSGTISDFDVTALQVATTPSDTGTYSIRYSGYINISTTNTYTFYTNSDDGSKLYINGAEIVDNDGNHGTQERNGSIFLNAGSYPFTVLYFEDGGSHSLSVLYSSPSITKTNIPFSVLSSECDYDGDGISNSFDLDSDNDGCNDVLEAGYTDDNRDGVIDGTGFNANGTVEGSNGYNGTNSSVTDETDKSGCQIDLSLSKTVNKPIFILGETVLYTIRITNSGRLLATNVQVKDVLPTGLTYVSGSSIIPNSTTYNPTTGIWDLSAISIATGQTISLQVGAIVNTTAVKLNTAEIISSDQEDIDSVPNNGN